jgi:hypothetical protein
MDTVRAFGSDLHTVLLAAGNRKLQASRNGHQLSPAAGR